VRGTIPPLRQYVFIVWCLAKHRDNFTFTFKDIALLRGLWRWTQV